MSQLLIHPQTELKTKAYLQRPTHALLLTGEEGSGKLYLAKWLAEQMELPFYILEAEEGKSSITIEQVRTLYSLTRTGSSLLVIVKDAGSLSREAQNAFLKLLEEPPKGVLFALTASSQSAVLPTIRSRSQEIKVIAPKKDDLRAYIAENFSIDPTELSSLIYTAKGLPGKLINQLEDETLKSSQQDGTVEAKRFYTSTPYERHIICLEHGYDKEWSTALLEILGLIVGSLFRTTKTAATTEKFRAQANLIEETAQNILKINGNPKIHLAKLCQQL